MRKHISLLLLWLFTLNGYAALTLNTAVPNNGKINVGINSKIVLMFNENITLGSGECTLNGEVIIPSISGKVATFTSSSPLQYFTQYNFVVPSGAIVSTTTSTTLAINLSFTTTPKPLPLGCSVRVAKDGSGNFSTIQAAINAAPSNASDRHIIYVQEGTYEECIVIPQDKKNITLWGEHQSHVVIECSDSDKPAIDVQSEGCYLFKLTVRNNQNKALNITGDKTMVRYCEISAPGSLSMGKCRAYFYQCSIEGASEIIESQGTAHFDFCTMKTTQSGAVVSAQTESGYNFGLVFTNSRIVSSANEVVIAKAKNSSAKVSFHQSEFPSSLSSDGWDYNDFPNAKFSEYMNFGPGAKNKYGVVYLDTETAKTFNTQNILKTSYDAMPVTDNWNPFSVLANTGRNAETWIEGDGLGANRGGNGGTEVTVSTYGDLAKYISSNDRYIIKIKGTINMLHTGLSVGSNTTITGVDESSTIIGNLQIPSTSKDVIIKYLNITHPGELKSFDGISMEGAHRVLVNHVSFYDCSDGVCDMRNSTDSVTSSWNKVYYVNQTDGHRFTMIADGVILRDINGETIGFGEPLNITFHNNWWSTMCDQRMPSSTNAKAHLYNCYWSCEGNFYCSLARENSEFYSENNYYSKVRDPLGRGTFKSKIYSSGNTYHQCSGEASVGKDAVKKPDYKYILSATKDIPDIVSARAGNVWIDPNYVSSGIWNNVQMKSNPVVSFVNGVLVVRLSSPAVNCILEMYSIQGSLIERKTFNGEQVLKMDLDLPTGPYVVKLNDNGKEYSQVIIR